LRGALRHRPAPVAPCRGTRHGSCCFASAAPASVAESKKKRSWSRDARRRWESMVKCPCLYSTAAPICRADLESMHVPPLVHLNRFCLTEHYRPCVPYRPFLELLPPEPGRWPVQGPGNGPPTAEEPALQ